MSDSASPEPPVRRKIRTASASAGPMDDRAARAWRQITARALKTSVGMNAKVTEVALRPVPADDLPELVREGEMSALIENGAGDIGLALVSPDLVAALVEQQTIGKVTERPAAARVSTPVDAALVGPSVDRILDNAGLALAEAGLNDPVTEYRFAMLTEPGTPPTLSMADLLHSCLTLEVSVEGGRKSGTLRLVIPDTGASAEQKVAGRADWQKKMGAAILSSDVTVEARLGRVRMPIEQVMTLSVGDVVPLSYADLKRVRLIVGHGAPAARARLGQSNGFRAVKIVGDDSTDGDPVWTQAEINGSEPG